MQYRSCKLSLLHIFGLSLSLRLLMLYLLFALSESFRLKEQIQTCQEVLFTHVWVCPLSIQLCPLSVQTCLLSIHCWLCNYTLIRWLYTLSTVTEHIYVFTWLVKVWMFCICPRSIQLCPLSVQICLLSIHIVNYAMRHSEKILDYDLAEWNFWIKFWPLFDNFFITRNCRSVFNQPVKT